MGVYNTVKVPCPSCGKEAYIQTKSGECDMITYRLDEAPSDDLPGLQDKWERCQCGTTFEVEIEVVARVKPID